MKPLTEHSNLEPGRRGIVFESLVELGVLATGLRYMVTEGGVFPGLAKEADKLLSFVDDLNSGIQGVMARPTAADLEINVSVPLLKPAEVMLGEMSVSAVASNEPGATSSPGLQDPMQHEIAIGMMTEYRAANAALDAGQQPPTPPGAGGPEGAV
ncbi:MAG TPA: hypothetical protein VLF62_06060 [Candidatus Saccharimonadales bacterium]|nr:hypothetical protein [Candidatus Saccharimonadales bacterium]